MIGTAMMGTAMIDEQDVADPELIELQNTPMLVWIFEPGYNSNGYTALVDKRDLKDKSGNPIDIKKPPQRGRILYRGMDCIWERVR